MIKPLLIEIGVEELPAIPFLKELPNIEKKWANILEKNALNCQFDFFYSPRRLVLWHSKFPEKQPQRYEEFFGAPKEIAFKDGVATNATLSFAKKCDADVNELEFIKKGDKEVLYYKKNLEASESKKLVGSMVEEFLLSLNFGKSMRWGSENFSFIRPIRWVGAMFGDEHISFKIFNLESKYFSYPHRSLSYEPFAYDFAGDYFEKLEKNYVILYADKRREIILSQMQELEQKEQISIEKNQSLLDEVVAITEYPTALIGSFDEKYLSLPDEVIVTSMREHQRYFPVFKNSKLTNKFVVVSNAVTDDFSLIISGNEKVLEARLSDAFFFWENDLKQGLNNEGLKKVSYMKGLGSIYDKTQREIYIGEYLTKQFMPCLEEENKKDKTEIVNLMKESISLAKADLLSEMVYEFTELQGIMGYYYAKHMKKDDLICLSIKEQYLPDGSTASLPSTKFSSIVSISNKLDSILSLFSIGKAPSGTKDPFSLRRAANGIIRIVLDKGFEFDIKKVLNDLSNNYSHLKISEVEEFFLERLYQIFDVNPSMLTSVFKSGERDFCKIQDKILALQSVLKGNEKESVSTFKRVANIIKDMELSQNLSIDLDLFEQYEEKVLYNKFQEVIKEEEENYKNKLYDLFLLKPFIDDFFDKVMVNVDNEKIKTNRKNLIALIYLEFYKIADIKEISL